jgi:hypothetical protein
VRNHPLILLSLLLFPVALQAANYSIDWFTVAGGGLRSSSGSYVLHGTVGQPAVGSMAKSGYAMVGGFWSFSASEPPVAEEPPLAGVYAGIDLTDPTQALADLDGDGVPNLMEYALGTDPRNPNDAQAGMITFLDKSVGGPYLSLTFKRRKDNSVLSLQYIPEVSGDAQTWSSVNLLPVSVVPLDAQFDWVTVSDLTATTVSSPRFIRLRIVEN